MLILVMADAAEAATYTIKPGDNLWKIARQYNTSVDQIKHMNKLLSNKLDVGQQIQVPDNKSLMPPAVQPVASRSNRVVTPASTGTQVGLPEAAGAVEVSRGAAIRRNLISNAFGYIGRPYRYGGMSPKGFDCSGFVGYIYKSCGISLPHNAAQQFNKGTMVDKNNLIPGDLVFFRTGGSRRINHVGIYIGENRFIHAALKKGISITSLDSNYYSKCYAGARRIISN